MPGHWVVCVCVNHHEVPVASACGGHAEGQYDVGGG